MSLRSSGRGILTAKKNKEIKDAFFCTSRRLGALAVNPLILKLHLQSQGHGARGNDVGAAEHGEEVVEAFFVGEV